MSRKPTKRPSMKESRADRELQMKKWRKVFVFAFALTVICLILLFLLEGK